MRYVKFHSGFLFLVFFYMTGISFAQSADKTEDKQMFSEGRDRGTFYSLVGIEDDCEDIAPKERPPFHFDYGHFGLMWKKPTKRMSGIDSAEGGLSIKTASLPSVFTGITRLFGICSWWPEDFLVIVGMRNQVHMGRLDFGDWEARLAGSSWNPSFELRWYIEPASLYWLPITPDSDSILFVGLEHNHWSGRFGGQVEEEGFDFETYIAENRINIAKDGGANVISLRFGQMFWTFDGALQFSHVIGYNLWQAPFDKFLSSFVNKDERSSYLYRWYIDAEQSLRIVPGVNLSLTEQTEFSDDEMPLMIEPAFVTFLPWLPNHTFRIFRREYFGVEKNSMRYWRWGVLTDSPVIRGFEFRFLLNF